MNPPCPQVSLPIFANTPRDPVGCRERRRLREFSIPPDPLEALYKLLALYAVACSIGCIVGSSLVWNATASLPLGLYWKTLGPTSRRDDLVALRIPGPVQRLVHDRRYLPDDAWLVKPIAAAPGDTACIRDGTLFVNERPFGAVLTEDHKGRPLPHDDFCGVVPAGKVYLASAHPGSFDSRSFGPVSVSDLQSKVVPLWTY